MAKKENKSKRIMQIVLTIFVIAAVILIVGEIAGNVAYEVASGSEMENVVSEVTPTPQPTLTDAERQELLLTPVGEDY